MTEGFPPHYQQLLERLLRRLAEEKPAGEGTDDGAAGPVRAKAAVGADDNAAALSVRRRTPQMPPAVANCETGVL